MIDSLPPQGENPSQGHAGDTRAWHNMPFLGPALLSSSVRLFVSLPLGLSHSREIWPVWSSCEICWPRRSRLLNGHFSLLGVRLQGGRRWAGSAIGSPRQHSRGQPWWATAPLSCPALASLLQVPTLRSQGRIHPAALAAFLASGSLSSLLLLFPFPASLALPSSLSPSRLPFRTRPAPPGAWRTLGQS